MKQKNILKILFPFSNPARLILNLYLVVILIGTTILMLPISSSSGEWTKPIDALFTTVSAVCVTGLTTVTTAFHWNAFGKTVIISLIQLGGLGVMTVSSIVFLLFNEKFTISERIILSEEKNVDSITGIIKLVKFIIISTFIIEFIGAVFLSFTFIPEFGIGKGIIYSIFHSISAFCNAGFDIIGAESLLKYKSNINISLVISFLIIIGGIGHKVILDILKYKFNYKKYSVHTKLVLIITTSILVIPTILFTLLESSNSQTMQGLPLGEKILMSFFQSATLRTAGYFTVQQGVLTNASFLLGVILMFVGGSPAGTAGGFKTTTAALLFFITRANVRNEKDINIFNRRVQENAISKVISIFTISLIWIFGALLLVSIFDPLVSFADHVYEIVSAYATVGLTRGITPNLSSASKLVVSATMLFGKVGPLSIVIAFMSKTKTKNYRYIEESILIG